MGNDETKETMQIDQEFPSIDDIVVETQSIFVCRTILPWERQPNANWIEDLFWEFMRYVPHAQLYENNRLYHCFDCGELTSSGLHCDKR